jgi:hypothetical protein
LQKPRLTHGEWSFKINEPTGASRMQPLPTKSLAWLHAADRGTPHAHGLDFLPIAGYRPFTSNGLLAFASRGHFDFDLHARIG